MTNNDTLLDGIDPEIVDTLVSRRDAIIKGGKVSGGMAAALALGSAPIALGALARTAYAQAPSDIINVLQFALLLENFEAEFYKAVLGTSTVNAFNNAFAPVRATVTATEAATLQLIRDHEIAHVNFLTATIASLGGTPTTYAPATTFDFTGGRGTNQGPFAQATTDKAFLLLTAQVAEDTGVRAYKGQAGNLISNNTVLQAALQIHSLEARHASKIRRMRRIAAGAPDTIRYSGTIRGGDAAAAGATGTPPGAVVTAAGLAYANEQNTSHVVNNGTSNVTINLTTLTGLPGGTNALTQAFDEPLTRAQVIAIVQPFVIPTIS